MQRLGEEVRQVVVRRDEGHANLQVLDALAHVEVAPVDVLGLGMVLARVAGASPGRLQGRGARTGRWSEVLGT